MFSTAMLVPADVDGYAIQPSSGIVIDSPEVAKQPKKYFLSGVLRVFDPAQETVCGPQNQALVSCYQFLESVFCLAFSGKNRQC
jgi:hypothetical protein